MNLHATLKNQKNKIITDNILQLNVQSEIQKKEIIDNLNIILDFLKKKLDIPFLKININIDEFNEEKVLYTHEDKLKYIIKEKPKVLELIKKLNLKIKE